MARLAERQRPLLRREYKRMVDAGLFENERIELIRGIIVRMSPQKAAHATVVQIEVHTEPSHGAYARVTPHRVGSEVAPSAFADARVSLVELCAVRA